MKKKLVKQDRSIVTQYESVLVELTDLIETARRSAAQSVNSIMTAAYWLIGRRIVEVEQTGKTRADYGIELLKRLACDLTDRFNRGFSERNLEQMRLFYAKWPISQTVSAKSSATFNVCGNRVINRKSLTNHPFAIGPNIFQTPSGKSQTVSAEMDMPDEKVLVCQIQNTRRRIERGE
jgi:hypothetical protein